MREIRRHSVFPVTRLTSPHFAMDIWDLDPQAGLPPQRQQRPQNRQRGQIHPPRPQRQTQSASAPESDLEGIPTHIRIPRMNSPEDIARWIADRRRRWPRAGSVGVKRDDESPAFRPPPVTAPCEQAAVPEAAPATAMPQDPVPVASANRPPAPRARPGPAPDPLSTSLLAHLLAPDIRQENSLLMACLEYLYALPVN
jgi:hypothetical protein